MISMIVKEVYAKTILSKSKVSDYTIKQEKKATINRGISLTGSSIRSVASVRSFHIEHKQ